MKKASLFFTGLTLMLFFSINITAQNNPTRPIGNNKPDTIVIKSVSLDIKNFDKLESFFRPQKRSFISEWGILIVAIVALIGSVLTSLLSNRRSRINTEKQLRASENNIIIQIAGNKDLESEKKKLELFHKNKNELKENVAKFIKEAQKLNEIINDLKKFGEKEVSEDAPKTKEFNPYTDSVLVHLQNWREKPFNYGDSLRDDIEELRIPLTDLYYSIKISLDSSANQKKLEELLDDYMKVALFREDLFQVTPAAAFYDNTAKIYHQIKSIVHDNYQVPS